MAASVRPFEEGFGAEVVGVDLAQPLAESDRAAIYRAFLDHHLVSIRGQPLTPAQTVAAARIFGDALEPHLFKHYHHPETPLIMVLSNRVEDGKPKGMADAGTFWHSDVSYKPNPAKATMLYAIEVPEGEGDTLFCDLTAAYEALPAATKRRLAGLKAVHNYDHVPRDVFQRAQRHAAAGLPAPGGAHPPGNRPQGDLRQPGLRGAHRGSARRRERGLEAGNLRPLPAAEVPAGLPLAGRRRAGVG